LRHGSAEATTPGPSPETTRRPGVEGVPVQLGDGREWHLARVGLLPALDEMRDKFFDAATLVGTYDETDQGWIRAAAYHLIAGCHDIDAAAASALIIAAPIRDLAPAVEVALFGEESSGLISYSLWARTSLRKNGIDPLALPLDEVRPTLDALESAGLALPREMIGSVSAAQRRANRPKPTQVVT
jgi:hypothetical protein